MKDEEIMYDGVMRIIERIQKEERENGKTSVLQTILDTDGLDQKEKISGVIGKNDSYKL